VAAILLNRTDVMLVRFAPLTITAVPTGPDAGLKDVIVGAVTDVTVKVAVLIAVPAGFVTLIGPVVAPVGTVTVNWVAELMAYGAGVPLISTAVAPAKPDPVITTWVPTGPVVGVKDEIVGATATPTVNAVALVAVPPGVVTLIMPVEAPGGTVAVMLVGPFTTNQFAGAVLNRTDVAPFKVVPVMVTKVPTGPIAGVKLVILGAGMNANPEGLLAIPPFVVTEISPVVLVLLGTTAVMLVSFTTEKLVAATVLKVTAVAVVKADPVRVTTPPAPIAVGVKLVKTGAG
jgi:hypothetical protein